MSETNFYEEFTEENLLEELQGERLYIEPSPIPEEEPDYPGGKGNSLPTPDDIEPENNPLQLKSPELATLLVSLVDVGGAVALGFLAKTDDRKKYRLDEEEAQTLEKAIKTYLDTSNVKMSPKTLLVSSLAVIYGPRTIDAVAERRASNEIKIRKETKDDETPEKHTEDNQ